LLQPKHSIINQIVFSCLFVAAVAFLCFAFNSFLEYQVVALLLLLTVSIIAITCSIMPVLISAITSALIWNYYFIPPRFTFHITRTEDIVLFVMYFLIVMINAVLTNRIRKFEKIARKKEERTATLKLYSILLNSLSHELRTPIATIIGAADTLQASHNLLSAESRGELLAEIARASLRLNHQVENLLNMSRLESGFIQPKNDWCDISEIVYSAINRIEENKYTQAISVNIDPLTPLIRSDKNMIEEIIYNLLVNACIYTQWNASININVQCIANILSIIVEDNGPGFPEDEVHRVFDKFYRLKNSKPGGTGLGLSIVKGFAEVLNGTANLKNNQGGGAYFTIVIPVKTTTLNKKPELWMKRKF